MNINDYYLRSIIKFQLFQQCKNREVFFKGYDNKIHLRPLAIYSMDGVDYNIKRFFNKRKYHFYASLAKLDIQSFGNPPSNLKDFKDYRERFHKEYEKFVTGYDFAIDIDNDLIRLKNPEKFNVKKVVQRQTIINAIKTTNTQTTVQAKRELSELIKYKDAYEFSLEENLAVSQKIGAKVKEIYDQYYLPYYILNSGKKGFHFRIDWEDTPKQISPVDFVEKTKLLAKNIAEEIGYTFGEEIDAIYDLKRVMRVPYSVHPETEIVALPLSNNQYNDFNFQKYSVDNIFNTVTLKNRGLLKRRFEKLPDWDGFFKSFGN